MIDLPLFFDANEDREILGGWHFGAALVVVGLVTGGSDLSPTVCGLQLVTSTSTSSPVLDNCQRLKSGVFSRGWTVTSRSKIWTFLLVVSSLAIHPSSTSSLGLAWIYPGLSVGGVDLRINCTVVGSTFGLHPLTNLNLVDR